MDKHIETLVQRYVITFLHIRYIKKTFGNHIGKSMLFFVKRYLR